MTAREKYLYHQIHPLKLLADFTAALISLYLLWQHRLPIALLVMFALPLIASIFVTQYVNLEACERSALGGAVARYMSHSLELIRLLGMAIMAIGAWFHSLAAIFLGLTVIILIWMRVVLRAG
jgi:hypothetical protein